MIPPATAAEANSIARNTRPLPRKTVAKNRSSSSPRRSRNTAINHRKAMPANGTRFSAKATSFELVLSHAPVSRGSARTKSWNTTSSAIKRTEKMMPATAAARGVFNCARIRGASCFMLEYAIGSRLWYNEMHVLPQMVERAEFEAVRNYVRGERPDRVRMKLLESCFQYRFPS